MSTRTTAPIDASGHTIIQALRPKTGAGGTGAHHISASGTTARNSTKFNADTRAVEIKARGGDMFYRFGDPVGLNDTVVATTSDHFIEDGERLLYSLGGDRGGNLAQSTHVAVIMSSGSGTFSVTELE